MKSEADGLIAIGLLLILLVGLPLSIWRKRRNPDKLPFTWGYLQSFSGCACLLMVPFVLTDAREGLLVAMLLLIPGICGVFMYRRHRWAWIVGTVLGFNLITYIINFVYLKNRWKEMAGERLVGSAKSVGAPVAPPSAAIASVATPGAEGEFYVAFNQTAVGPLTWSQVLAMHDTGAVNAATQCARAGDSQWRRFDVMTGAAAADS